MRLLLVLFIGANFIGCKTTKPIATSWYSKKFNFFYTQDTIELRVTYFAKNSVLCMTEAIPYALIIGETGNLASQNIPKVITVLARCDNNNYALGQNLKVLRIEDPTIQTDLIPLYVMKDTVINKQKYHWLIGSDNPAIWGKVL